MATSEVETPCGPARLHVHGAGPARLLLGHGAGGGLDSPDLGAARDAGLGLGWEVVLVEQPWRVRGRRVAEPPPRLDAAWRACLRALPPLPTVTGGRSAGARVACRTATGQPQPHLLGVLCLAFPLRPPGGAADRAGELALPAVPRLVVQGTRDAFGVPDPSGPPGRPLVVHVVAGADHAFRTRRADGRTAGSVRAEIQGAVAGWLAGLTCPSAPPGSANRIRERDPSAGSAAPGGQRRRSR